jgi:rubrerythrin
MEIIEAFDTMVQLEKNMSECYREISQVCHDEEISKELMTLSKEEIDHMNLLATGKNYLKEAPDIFSLKSGRIAELSFIQNNMIKLISDIRDKKKNLIEAINDAAELERILEQFHLNRIAEVKDASLKKLFETLSLGDKEHKKRLFRVMESLYPSSQ